jgi:PhnB protein
VAHLGVATIRAVRGYWDGLTNGGTVAVPLEKAPWGDTFRMCADKLGINWLVSITYP